jgi:hypothetical protein
LNLAATQDASSLQRADYFVSGRVSDAVVQIWSEFLRIMIAADPAPASGRLAAFLIEGYSVLTATANIFLTD